MITKVVKFEVKPEASEALKTVLSENKTGAAQEAGSVEMRIFVDRKNPNLFFFYERFTDEAALNAHKEQSYKDASAMSNNRAQMPDEAYIEWAVAHFNL